MFGWTKRKEKEKVIMVPVNDNVNRRKYAMTDKKENEYQYDKVSRINDRLFIFFFEKRYF